ASQELASGGPELGVRGHRGADTAVEARRPAAVVLLALVQRDLPVGPQPLLLQTGVEVVTGKDLVLGALPGGEPVEVDPVRGQLLFRAADPALEGEVLVPTVEPATFPPNPFHDPADPPVAA